MATIITSECINCGACEPECPNTAIYQGGVEWEMNGVKGAALSNEIFFIVPDKCTECVGFFDHEACAAVCPVDCCVPDPNRPETEAALMARTRQLHPDKTFPDEFPSRFKTGGAGEGGEAAAAAAPATAAPVPTAAPILAASAPAAVAVRAEDALAAEIPDQDDYEVPLSCFRCSGRFAVALRHLRPGTVLHCPHCGGSYVTNTALYQSVARRVARFYDGWARSFEELCARREREIEAFSAAQRKALDQLASEVDGAVAEATLAGAPQRNRGFFG